jgi:hypothetical protein
MSRPRYPARCSCIAVRDCRVQEDFGGDEALARLRGR